MRTLYKTCLHQSFYTSSQLFCPSSGTLDPSSKKQEHSWTNIHFLSPVCLPALLFSSTRINSQHTEVIVNTNGGGLRMKLKLSWSFVSSQDEQYNHLEEGEMQQVREQVQAKREWLNTQMQVCSSLPKHADPPVKCSQIRAEKQVSHLNCAKQERSFS